MANRCQGREEVILLQKKMTPDTLDDIIIFLNLASSSPCALRSLSLSPLYWHDNGFYINTDHIPASGIGISGTFFIGIDI